MLTIHSIHLLTYFFLSHLANSYLNTDLEPTSIASDISSWSISACNSSPCQYDCNGNTILGGYGNIEPGGVLRRIYTITDDHDYIYIQFTLWRIDSWDLDDAVWLIIGDIATGTIFKFASMEFYSSSSNICGDPNWPDIIDLKILVGFAHIGTTLDISVKSYMTQDSGDESFGISDFRITMKTTSSTDKICYSSGTDAPGICTAVSTYPNFMGSGCDSTCLTCIGTTSANCLTCVTGYYYDGTYCTQCHYSCTTCLNGTACTSNLCTSGYAYWDYSCSATCNYPLEAKDLSGTAYCSYPCSSTEYLYWDGVCQPTCETNLVSSTFKSKQFCNSPCSSSNFLLYDGTCNSTCESILNQVNRSNVLFCNYPCASNMYLYWDGTCGTSCDYPLTNETIGSRYFCRYPCAISMVLYYNQTCNSICNSPLSLKIEQNRSFCDFNCSSGHYLYWNGSCISSCLSIYTHITWSEKDFCFYPCDLTQYLYWNGSCLDSCDYPLLTRIESSRNYCDYPCASIENLYWNGTCLINCSPPLQRINIQGDYFCQSPCLDSQYLYWNGSCLNTCDYPLMNSTQSSKKFCNFPCNITEYSYWNGLCGTTCDFPLVAKSVAGYLYCEYPCAKSSYLYWNGSCLPSCSFPLELTVNRSDLYCDFPCASGQYLYYDGICSFTCASPLVASTFADKLFCNSPCNSSQYLYQTQACLNDCPSPLIESSSIIKRCTSPCLSSQVVFPNGSCTNSCPSPRKNNYNHETTFCEYPCADNKIWSYLGECINSCNPPYILKYINGDKYCDSPCKRREYLCRGNNTCLEVCNSPYNIEYSNSLFYCNYPCSDKSLYLYENKTCASTCNFPFFPYLELDVLTCVYKCESPFVEILGVCQCPSGYKISSDMSNCEVAGAIGTLVNSMQSANGAAMGSFSVFLLLGANPIVLYAMVHLLQCFFFLNFYNVEYPIIITKFLKLFDISTLTFLPNPFFWLLEDTETSGSLRINLDKKADSGSDLPSPENFLYNHFSGYFLQSAGSVIGIFLCVFSVYFSAKILEKYVEDGSRLARVLQKTVKLMEWSGLYRLITLFFMKLTIASSLQIRVLEFSESRFTMSSLLALLTFIFILSLPVGSWYIIHKGDKIKDKKKFKAIYEDFDEKSFMKKYFTVINLTQRILICTAIVTLYYLPPMQILFPWSIYLFSFLNYSLVRPHSSRSNNFLHAVSDLGFVVIHTIIMLFSMNDYHVVDLDYDQKESLGLVFVFVCLGVLFARMFLTITFGFVDSYRRLKKILSKPITKKVRIRTRNGMLATLEKVQTKIKPSDLPKSAFKARKGIAIKPENAFPDRLRHKIKIKQNVIKMN